MHPARTGDDGPATAKDLVPVPNPAGVDGVGAGYSVTSGGLSVLMDQPTESISSHDAPSRHEGKWFAGPQRCRLPQSAMRAMAV